MGKVSNTDAAWASGFFDGEGCIGAYRQYHGKIYMLEVDVGQVELPVLQKLKRLFGGGVYRLNWKTYSGYRWRLSKKKAISSLIDIIYPYSIVKKTQLEAARTFLQKWPRGTPARVGDPEADTIFYLLRDLKRQHRRDLRKSGKIQ